MPGPDKNNELIKCIVIGDEKVGKTALLQQACQNNFPTVHKPTVGADFFNFKDSTNENSDDFMQVWDTAGNSRLAALNSAFYRGSDAVVIVVDASLPKDQFDKALSGILDKYESFSSTIGGHRPVFLVANKIDAVNAGSYPLEEVEAKLNAVAKNNFGSNGQNNGQGAYVHLTDAKKNDDAVGLFMHVKTVVQLRNAPANLNQSSAAKTEDSKSKKKHVPESVAPVRNSENVTAINHALNLIPQHLVRNLVTHKSLHTSLTNFRDGLSKLTSPSSAEPVKSVSNAVLSLVKALYGEYGNGFPEDRDLDQISKAMDMFHQTLIDNFPSNHFVLKLGLAVLAATLLITAATLTGGLALPVVAGVTVLVGAAIGAGVGTGIVAGTAATVAAVKMPAMKQQYAEHQQTQEINDLAQEVMNAANQLKK